MFEKECASRFFSIWRNDPPCEARWSRSSTHPLGHGGLSELATAKVSLEILHPARLCIAHKPPKNVYSQIRKLVLISRTVFPAVLVINEHFLCIDPIALCSNNRNRTVEQFKATILLIFLPLGAQLHFTCAAFIRC